MPTKKKSAYLIISPEAMAALIAMAKQENRYVHGEKGMGTVLILEAWNRRQSAINVGNNGNHPQPLNE